MDIGEYPYTTQAHLYPDSDEVFTIVWYPARDDVPFLRGPSAINNLTWEGDREDWLPTAVGEIFGAPRTRNWLKVNPAATGGHTCGTAADFAGYGSFDDKPPFVTYQDNGLPTCCPPRFAPLGGLVADGITPVVFYRRTANTLVMDGFTIVVRAVVAPGGPVVRDTPFTLVVPREQGGPVIRDTPFTLVVPRERGGPVVDANTFTIVVPREQGGGAMNGFTQVVKGNTTQGGLVADGKTPVGGIVRALGGLVGDGKTPTQVAQLETGGMVGDGITTVTTGTTGPTSRTSSGGTGTMGVLLPSNVNGDLLVVCLQNNSGSTPTTPAGWTFRGGVATGTGNNEVDVYTRVSPGGLTVQNFTVSGVTDWSGVAYNFGARSWVSITVGTGGNSASLTTPAQTIANANSYAGHCYVQDSPVVATITPDPALTRTIFSEKWPLSTGIIARNAGAWLPLNASSTRSDFYGSISWQVH